MAKTITDKQRDDLLRSRGFNLSSSSNEKRHVTNEEKYKLLRSRGFDLEMASSERQKDDMYRRYGQSASEFWDSIPRKTKNNVSAVSRLISNPNNNTGYFNMLAGDRQEDYARAKDDILKNAGGKTSEQRAAEIAAIDPEYANIQARISAIDEQLGKVTNPWTGISFGAVFGGEGLLQNAANIRVLQEQKEKLKTQAEEAYNNAFAQALFNDTGYTRNNSGYFDMLAKEQAEKSIYGSHYSDAKNAEYDLAAYEKRMGEIAEGARNRSGGSVNEITGAFRAAEADKLAAQFYIDYGKKYGANIDAASVQRGIKAAPAFQDYLSAEASGTPMNEAQILAMYINADDKTRKNIEMSLVGSEAIVGNARHLTAKQKEVYNAILGEKGAEAARQYIEDSKPLLSSQKYQAEKAEALKYGNEHKGQAFFSTALAAPASGLDYITSLTDYVAGPREVQLDNEGNVFSLADYRTEIRNQALSNIANNANSKLQATVGQFLYSTAASMADNVVNQVAGGEVGSLVLMGMSAANDAYEDAKARGMNEGDALIKGAVSGGIEALTEKVGIDNLFDTFRAGGGATFTSFIKEMLKQGGIEAAEELTSNLANLAYAALAEGDNAAFRQRYNELISQGETESKAAGMVAGELVQEALTDALGGFVSGGIMSGGAQTIGRAMGYGGSGHYTTDIQTQQALLDEAKELGGKAASLAEKYQTQLDSGKALSKSQYETLVDANDSIIAKTEKAKPQSRLKEAAGKVAAQNAAKKLGAVNTRNAAQNVGGVNTQSVQNNAGASVITPEISTIAAPAVNVENRNIDTEAMEAAKKAGTELAAMGDTFTESARDGFKEGYSPVSESGERVSVKEYTAAFNTLVNAITSGRGIEKATQSIRGIVGEKNLGTVMMAAEYQVMDTQLKSGAAANTKAQAKINKLKAKYAGSAVRTEGKVTFADGAAVQSVSKEESNQIKIMQAHARVFGTNIEITRTLEENGHYDAKTNTITIALDADNALIKVAAHELTHFIARWSPGKYQTLVDFLKDYYNGKKEGSFNRMVRDKQNAYSAQKKHISYNDAVEEVVADASELFLGVGITDGEYINIAREIRDTDKALYEKIGEFISDAAELTSAAGEIGEASSREAARLTADREAFSRAEKLWYEAMADASETSAALNGEMQGKGIKHSLNPNFEAEYDTWVQNGRKQETLTVGKTSDVLVGLGAKKQEIKMYSADIAHALRHDGMSDTVMKQVPGILENPVVILKSLLKTPKNKGEASRLVMYGTAYDENGTPVLALLELKPRGDGGHILDMQLVKNAYGKDYALKEQFEKSDVVYIDPNKNRTDKWMHSLGLQLPSDTTKYGSIGSILYAGNSVKIQGVPYLEIISKETAENVNKKFELRDNYSGGGGNGYDGYYVETWNGTAWEVDTEQFNEEEADIRYSIRQGMTEAERYQELKDAEIFVAEFKGDFKLSRQEVENLETATRRDAREYAQKLFNKFGLKKSYANKVADIEFEFSKKGLEKSLHEQVARNASYGDFGKMLACFDEIVDNAIPVEIHSDIYTGTQRQVDNLIAMYVLVSAYENEGIIPVQLEIKEYSDVDNKLYIAVTMCKIKEGVLVTAPPSGNSGVSSVSRPSNTISIRELFKNINPADGEFLKYVPDGFLNDEQKAAKKDALEKEAEKIRGYREDAEKRNQLRGLHKTNVEAIIGEAISSSKEAAEINSLIEANAELKERINQQDDIIAELNRQMKPTAEFSNDRRDIEKYARQLKKDYSSTTNADIIADVLEEMYREMMRPAPNDAYIRQLGITLAREILNDSQTMDTAHEETFEPVRKALKAISFHLTDAQKAEIKAVTGMSYGEFRRSVQGMLDIRDNARLSLDEQWGDITAAANGMLEANVNEGDQITELFDLVKYAQPQVVNEFAATMDEMAVDMFMDMRDAHFEMRTAKGTYADKMLEKVKKAKEAGYASKRKALDAQKTRYEEKFKKLNDSGKARFAAWKENQRAETRRKAVVKRITQTSERLMKKWCARGWILLDIIPTLIVQ